MLLDKTRWNKNDFLYLMMRNVSRYQDMKLLLSGGLPKYKDVPFNKNIEY